MSLRLRLFASYLLLLALTIGVITFTLLLFLSSSPEPNAPTYQRLANLLQGFQPAEISVDFFERNPEAGQPSSRDLLRTFAQSSGIRILIVSNTPLNPNNVLFDSADTFQQGDTIPLVRDSRYHFPSFEERVEAVPGLSVNFGEFMDLDGKEWLYTALIDSAPLGRRTGAIVFADRQSERTLQSALGEFGAALALPLTQSATIGLIVAFILAALISSTIARPLKHFATAAKAVAQGDYNHAVPLEGAAEVRAVAEAFNHMTEEVRKAQQSQRDFLANVSHDLKTPLTSIQGYSQAIMDGTAKDPARAAAIISDEAGRLTRMVTELTELARLQAGATQMQILPLDVGQIVRSITQRLAVVAQKKDITLHSDILPMLMIAGDGDRLAQVFTNLISNAIHYTPEGGAIFITTQQGEGGVEIIIRDTGVGIPREELERIFERFYQVDKTRGPQRGTGLGLAISREIVLAHGGQIHVSSPGKGLGATFTVWLPAAAVPELAHYRGNAVHA